MAKIKRSITLVQRPGGGDQYQVVQIKNTTDYNIGQTVKRTAVDAIIREGIEVNIKGK